MAMVEGRVGKGLKKGKIEARMWSETKRGGRRHQRGFKRMKVIEAKRREGSEERVGTRGKIRKECEEEKDRRYI